MVRRDPLNERGPVPGTGRPRRPPVPTNLFELHPEDEYIRIMQMSVAQMWGTLIALEHYKYMGLPIDRDTQADLEHLKERIAKL